MARIATTISGQAQIRFAIATVPHPNRTQAFRQPEWIHPAVTNAPSSILGARRAVAIEHARGRTVLVRSGELRAILFLAAVTC